MALERKNRIKETTTTVGTGTLNLSGTSPDGFRTFVSTVTSGATVRYLIETDDQTEWEVGEGVFTDATPDTLTRASVFASSNSNNLVNFSAGTKNVSLVLTAEDLAKASKAEAAAGTDDAKFLTSLAASELWKLPEGSLWNGKIVPSVASNNLTVALKGKDGNDPSATNPVYVMIGGTLRTITAALSKTLNAGANTFNSGSAELATKEIDYFVYLGYNATDGVVIGFSRIPFANLYSDFSATATNEKFCSISTITNAAAGDNYVNIGRFAATLSAGAGYTWSVPTFTASNLIQRPIYETRWMDWIPTLTNGAADLSGYTSSRFIIKGRTCYIYFYAANKTVSGSAGFIQMSLPIAGVLTTKQEGVWLKDGTNWLVARSDQNLASSTIDIFKTAAAGNWAANETGVYINISCFYEI